MRLKRKPPCKMVSMNGNSSNWDFNANLLAVKKEKKWWYFAKGVSANRLEWGKESWKKETKWILAQDTWCLFHMIFSFHAQFKYNEHNKWAVNWIPTISQKKEQHLNIFHHAASEWPERTENRWREQYKSTQWKGKKCYHFYDLPIIWTILTLYVCVYRQHR